MVLKTLVLWLLVYCSFSKAEELTTENILDPADTWTTYDRASTQQCSYSGALEDGEVCTGSADQGGTAIGGGGIISQEYSLKDQGLSVAEMQQGFDLEYGASIESHISNTSVPGCENTTGDCRDYFTIKLHVTKSDGSSINTYEETVEMDYSGVRDYKYTQSIGANSYKDVNFKMDIWSVDAGYTSGYYGGIISDPFLEIQYKTVDIVTEVILDIVDDIVNDQMKLEEVKMEVVLENIYTDDLVFEMDFTDTSTEEMIIEIPETIEEAQEVVEIEAEIETEMEMTQETTQEVVPEKQIKQKIANKLMAKQEDKTSNEAQTTQLALMVVLSDVNFTDLTTTQIQDTNYYEDLTFYNTQDMIQDNGANLIGYMDYLGINKMVDSQWQN